MNNTRHYVSPEAEALDRQEMEEIQRRSTRLHPAIIAMEKEVDRTTVHLTFASFDVRNDTLAMLAERRIHVGVARNACCRFAVSLADDEPSEVEACLEAQEAERRAAIEEDADRYSSF